MADTDYQHPAESAGQSMKDTVAYLVAVEAKLGIRRTLVLALAVWMTWRISEWGMWFAVGNDRNGMEIAAIIAAVTAPITLFAGTVFKTYVEGKVL